MGISRSREKSTTLPNNSEYHYRYSVLGTEVQRFYYPMFGPYTTRVDKCADQTHPGPPYREGGPLDVWHKEYGPHTFSGFDVRSGDWGGIPFYHYQGNWKLSEGLLGIQDPDGWLSFWGDGTAYGATGWKRFKPGKPGAQLAVFLGELRDLPRMFQFRLKKFKDIGSQYLNYRFGWRPFLNDLYRFFDTTQRLARRYEFLRRNNGKWIKRGGVVTTSTDTWEQVAPSGIISPILPSQFYPDYMYPQTPTILRWKEERKIWFEGSFRFWVPDLDNPGTKLNQIRQMYGLTISPDVVWELIPFSWLVDWFTNIGDVMSNLSDESAAPNLAARYAYVMAHTTRRMEVTENFHYYSDAVAKTLARASCSTYVKWERKQRAEATPYGFGLTWDSFTPGQLAILAALGISRRRQ